MSTSYTKHPRFYQDPKYYLIQVDKLNYAVVYAKQYEKFGLTNASLYGYYPNLRQALEALTHQKAEDRLLNLIRREGPFKNLEVLIKAYLEKALQMVQESVKEVSVE